MFRRGGYQGTESTFGVGGPWDGASLDGVVYQWQLTTHEADAEHDTVAMAANSIETSDGGDPSRPWSDKMLDSMLRLGVWWCEQTGHPPAPTARWNGTGFGYHRMFVEWNKERHSCPGDVREHQLVTELWPEIRRALIRPYPPSTDQSWPKFPLQEDDFYSAHRNSGIPYAEEGLRIWQRQMVARGWNLHVNGQFDTNCNRVCRQFQKEKGLLVDEKVGVNTWNAAWITPVT